MKGTVSVVIILTTVCHAIKTENTTAITENTTAITNSTIEDFNDFNTTEIQTTKVPVINQTEAVTSVNKSESHSDSYSNRTGTVSVSEQEERSVDPTAQEVVKNNLYTLIKIRLLGNLLQRLPVERRQFIFINAIKQVSKDANKESNKEKKAKAFSMQQRSFDDSKEQESGSQEMSGENNENSQEKSSGSEEKNTPQHNVQTQLELEVIKDQVSNDVKDLLNTVFPGVESSPSQGSVFKDMDSKSAIQYKPPTIKTQHSQHTNSLLKNPSISHSFTHDSTKSHADHDSRISGFASTDHDTHHVPIVVQRNFNFEKTQSPPMNLPELDLLSRSPYLGEYPHQENKFHVDKHSKDTTKVYFSPPSTTPFTVYQQPSLHKEPFQETLNLKPVLYSDSNEELPLSVTYFSKSTEKTTDSKENTYRLESLKLPSQKDEVRRHHTPQHTSTNSVEKDTSKSSEEEILSDLKFDSTTNIPNLELHPSEDVQDYYENQLLKSDQTNAEDAVKIIFDLFNDYDHYFEDYDNEKLNFDVELQPTSIPSPIENTQHHTTHTSTASRTSTSSPIENTQHHTAHTSTASHSTNFAAREKSIHQMPSAEIIDKNEDSSSSESNEGLTTDNHSTHLQSQQYTDTYKPSSYSLEKKKDNEQEGKGNDESSDSQEIKDTDLEFKNIIHDMISGSTTQSKKTNRNAKDASSSEEDLMTSEVLPTPLHSHFSNERYSKISKEEEERIFGFDSEEEYGRDGSDSEKTNSYEKDIYNNNILHNVLQSKGSSTHVNKEESTQNLINEMSKKYSNEQSGSHESSESPDPWYQIKEDEDSTVKSKNHGGKNIPQHEETSSASNEKSSNENYFSQSKEDFEKYDVDYSIEISSGSKKSGEDSEEYTNSESKEGERKSLLPRGNSVSYDDGGKYTHHKVSSDENNSKMERKYPIYSEDSHSTEDSTSSEEFDGNSKTIDKNSDESSREIKIENSESKIETSSTEKSVDSDSTEVNDDHDKHDEFSKNHEINNQYTREDQRENSHSREESNIDSDSNESGEILLQKDSISKEKSYSNEHLSKISHTSGSSESYSENKSIFRDDDKGSSSIESENIDSLSKDVSCEGEYCNSYSSESTSFEMNFDDSEEKESKNFDYSSSESTEHTKGSDQEDTEEISGQESNEKSVENDRSYTSKNAISENESASEDNTNSISSEEQNVETSNKSKSDSDEHSSKERSLFDTDDNDSSESLETREKTTDDQLKKLFSSESEEYSRNDKTKDGHNSNEKSNDDKQINEFESQGISSESGLSTSDENKGQSNEDMAYSQNDGKHSAEESGEQRGGESKVENEKSGKQHSNEGSQEQPTEEYSEEERGYSNDHDEPKEENSEETTDKYDISKEVPKEQDILKDDSNENYSTEEPNEKIKDDISRNSNEEPKDLIESEEIKESGEGSSGKELKDDDTKEEKGEGSNENRFEEQSENKEDIKSNEENPTEKKQEYGKSMENDEDTSMVENKRYEKNEDEYPEYEEEDDESNFKDEASNEDNRNKNDDHDKMKDEITNDNELENAVEEISDMFLFGFDESSSKEHTDCDSKKHYNTHTKYDSNGRVNLLVKKLMNLQQFWQKKRSGYGSIKSRDSPSSSDLQMKLPTLKYDLYHNPPRRRIYGRGSYSNYKRSNSHKSRNYNNSPSYRYSSYSENPLNYNGGATMPYESTIFKYFPSQWKYLHKIQSSNTRPRYGKSGYRSRRLKINFGNKKNFRKNYSESRTRNGLSRLSDILMNRSRNSSYGFRRVHQGSDNNYMRKPSDPYLYIYGGSDNDVIVHPVVTKSNY